MRTQTIKIGGGTLKTYLWDRSKELAVKSRPAVLVIPGGGYEFCSDREAEPIALAYAAEGFNAFVLRYTVKKSFEEPFAEANAAMKCITENAKAWSIRPDGIAVCGFSAGAHLACALGTMGEVRPRAMLLGYPAVVGKDWATHKPCIPDLVSKVNKDTSPAFVFSSCDDALVPISNSISLLAALDKCGVPFETHIFAQAQHGFSLSKRHTSSGGRESTDERAAQWFPLSVSWIKLVVGDVEF